MRAFFVFIQITKIKSLGIAIFKKLSKIAPMDLNINDEQKMAMASILMDIMNADDNVHAEEMKYFEQLQGSLDITDDQLRECLKLSVLDSMRVVKGLDHLQKEAFSFMMQEMIKADNEVDSREADVFVIVCTGADIPFNLD
jgi:uncharacterized tellurite resistance protein B-like protein